MILTLSPGMRQEFCCNFLRRSCVEKALLMILAKPFFPTCTPVLHSKLNQSDQTGKMDL